MKTEQLINLCTAHIRHYQNMLSSESKNIRRDECQSYLDIWLDTKASLIKNVPIRNDGKLEIIDAIYSGEYDDFFDLEFINKITDGNWTWVFPGDINE